MSTCAFPFGGNRNTKSVGCLTADIVPVYMCLPVWRESKLYAVCQVFRHVRFIQRLHVPSRSEGIETGCHPL